MILHIFMNLTWYVTFRMVWNCPICSRSWKLEVHTWKIAFRGLLFARTSYMKTKYRLWFYIFLWILRGMSRSVWFGIARFVADLGNWRFILGKLLFADFFLHGLRTWKLSIDYDSTYFYESYVVCHVPYGLELPDL